MNLRFAHCCHFSPDHLGSGLGACEIHFSFRFKLSTLLIFFSRGQFGSVLRKMIYTFCLDNNNNNNSSNNHIESHNSTFLRPPHCATNCLQRVCLSGQSAVICRSCAAHWVLIMCNTLGANHVQHIGCSSCATHWVQIMCNRLSAHHVQHIGCKSYATHWVLIMCNTLGANMQHIGC